MKTKQIIPPYHEPCAFNPKGATRQLCVQMTGLMQHNLNGCCVIKCTSPMRMCYACLTLGEPPVLSADPETGLCEFHQANGPNARVGKVTVRRTEEESAYGAYLEGGALKAPREKSPRAAAQAAQTVPERATTPYLLFLQARALRETKEADLVAELLGISVSYVHTLLTLDRLVPAVRELIEREDPKNERLTFDLLKHIVLLKPRYQFDMARRALNGLLSPAHIKGLAKNSAYRAKESA